MLKNDSWNNEIQDRELHEEYGVFGIYNVESASELSAGIPYPLFTAYAALPPVSFWSHLATVHRQFTVLPAKIPTAVVVSSLLSKPSLVLEETYPFEPVINPVALY